MAPRRTKAEPGTGVARLGELLDQAGMGGRGRRSPLARWLRAHHEAFAAMLADKDPNWTEVAAALAVMGVLDGGGRPPTGERVRKAWWEARHAVSAKPQVRQAAFPRVSGEIAPAVQAVPATTSTETHAVRTRPALDLRPAMPLNPSPAQTDLAGASSAASTGPTQPAGTRTEVLQRLHEQMSAGKISLPKVVR